MEKFLETLKLDDKGLITAVIQDAQNNDVLMVGYMNSEAVKRTRTFVSEVLRLISAILFFIGLL